MRPTVRLLLCAALGLLALPPAAATAHDGPHPADPVAQGRMHGVPYGYHSDAVSAVPDATVVAAVARDEWEGVPDAPVGTAAAGLPEEWCGDAVPALAPGEATPDDVANRVVPAGAPQFKVVYAYAADQPSRFGQLADKLQANVSLLSRFMARQSGDTKTLRFDMGTSCGAGYLDIQVIRLPRNLAEYAGPDFEALAADIRARIATTQPGPRDWIVYADRMRANFLAGTGEFYYGPTAESPTALSHDRGRLVSVVWGPAALPSGPYADPTTMLHEMGHNLGAVQGSAPHSTGYENEVASGHCTDEWDVMCYADGGPKNALTYPCATLADSITETFDCGGDDYFNPVPPPGSWLATHWNVYGSAMLGPCTGELAVACDTGAAGAPAPVNTTPPAPAGWVPAPYAVALSGTDATRWQWRVNGGPADESATASVLEPGMHKLETRVGSGGGLWSPWRTEILRLDGGPPSVSIACSQVGASAYACAGTASDPHAGLAALALSDGGAAKAVSPGDVVRFDGPATITATATDHAGFRATAQRAIGGGSGGGPGTQRVPVKVGDRRGRRRGTAQLTISTAVARRTAKLAVGRLPAKAGTWRLRACLRQSGRPARCRTRTVKLRRAGRLPAFSVSAELADGAVKATVEVARRHGRRYGRPALTARASAG